MLLKALMRPTLLWQASTQQACWGCDTQTQGTGQAVPLRFCSQVGFCNVVQFLHSWAHSSVSSNTRRIFFNPFISIFFKLKYIVDHFPGATSGKEPVCQPRYKRRGFNSWVGKIPWRRKWQPTPVFLPGEPHGQRSLADYSPWGCKELDTTEAT